MITIRAIRTGWPRFESGPNPIQPEARRAEWNAILPESGRSRIRDWPGVGAAAGS